MTFANPVDMNKYLVTELSSPITPTAEWDREPWNSIQTVELTFYMGDTPAHFPKVLAKIAYDEDAIYVIYKVEDQYVLAATPNYQGPVYTDSCVEFFFTPHEDVSLGYFNLEMNCGGTALFNFQPKPHTDRVPIAKTLGATEGSEAAVQAALAWLAAQQETDGHWNARSHGAGREDRVRGHDRRYAGIEADTGITGLALLSFLGTGHTHFEGTYRKSVQHGLGDAGFPGDR